MPNPPALPEKRPSTRPRRARPPDTDAPAANIEKIAINIDLEKKLDFFWFLPNLFFQIKIRKMASATKMPDRMLHIMVLKSGLTAVVRKPEID